jgi:hypothetical protein
MELISDVSLQQYLDRSGPLEIEETLAIGLQVVRGLAAAHAQGLVHRDIKPANILLEDGVGRVKITDFGLARVADEPDWTQSGVVAGTPQYMAPEQARGESVDERADLFSLGSVLYAMCTGDAPFRAGTALAVLRRVTEESPRPIRELNDETPEWLIAIIDRLLAKRPDERFQSAREVADLLGSHLARLQQPIAPPIEAGLQTEARLRRRAWWRSPSPARRCFLATCATLAVLGITLGFAEAGGLTDVATTIIRILTPNGTLMVEVDDPRVRVTVEGDGGLSIAGAGALEVRLRPGMYRVEASRDGKPVLKELVQISRGDRKVVTVTHETPARPALPAATGIPRPLTPAADDLLPNGAKDRASPASGNSLGAMCRMRPCITCTPAVDSRPCR